MTMNLSILRCKIHRHNREKNLLCHQCLYQKRVLDELKALNEYKKECSMCMTNAGGDCRCMAQAKNNLSRRIPR